MICFIIYNLYRKKYRGRGNFSFFIILKSSFFNSAKNIGIISSITIIDKTLRYSSEFLGMYEHLTFPIGKFFTKNPLRF